MCVYGTKRDKVSVKKEYLGERDVAFFYLLIFWGSILT